MRIITAAETAAAEEQRTAQTVIRAVHPEILPAQLLPRLPHREARHHLPQLL